jgi:pheromone shutdown protein TraB
VGAPIATVNPVLGVGLFAGLAQVWVRKPRVEDAETLNEAISSVKGIYRNRITRALLVFLLSSIGGIVGNAISIPSLAGFIFR